MKYLLIALATLTLAHSTAQAQANAPTVRPVAAVSQQATSKNYRNDITDLIQNSYQIVLRADALNRADVAEAIRQAIINRGSEVIIIGHLDGMMPRNSYLLRVALMKSTVYTYTKPATPYIILDGKVFTGSGIIGNGAITLTNEATAKQVINWTQNFVRTKPQTSKEYLVARWASKNLNVELKTRTD